MATQVIRLSSKLMLLLLLVQVHGSFGIPSNEVEDICSTTQNPSFCAQTLNADPRTPGADLKALAQISIDLANASATETAALVASLVKTASDPELQGRYQTCAENYDDSIYSLGECSLSVSSGDFTGLNLKASAAMEGATTCLDSFEGPPRDPSQLPSKSAELKNLCSSILAISKRLIG